MIVKKIALIFSVLLASLTISCSKESVEELEMNSENTKDEIMEGTFEAA